MLRHMATSQKPRDGGTPCGCGQAGPSQRRPWCRRDLRASRDRRSIHMTEPHGPLQGVRVVACSTAQAGTVPYMLMADLGADVIKIETPDGGDQSRRTSIL